MDLGGLLQDRVVLVTGKGGTGKTTYASAIALLLAARGRRTVLCELDSQRPSLTGVFGREPDFHPLRVAPNLDVCNLTWPHTLVAYLERMIRVGPIVKAILSNEMVRRFLDFTPGANEIVTLSVLADLREKYDVVVVDMPASGHAFSLLDITRSALGLFRAGPVRARVEELRVMIQAPTSRMVLVALPEEMVVNETLETLARLQGGQLLGGKPIVVLNRAIAPSLSVAEKTLLDRLSAEAAPGDAEEFVAAGRWDRVLEESAAEAQTRITEALGEAPILVPPSGVGGNPREVVRSVAIQLGRHLGVSKHDFTWGA